MGSSSSRRKLLFTKSEEYARWQQQDVRKALERWEAVQAQGTHIERAGTGKANRREFSEVFTDYHTITGGKFLALDMSHFDLYDRKKEQLIAVLEPMLMLLISCEGLVGDKIETLFRLLDTKRQGFLSSENFVLLIGTLIPAAHTMGLITQLPTMDVLTRLGEDMFYAADRERSGAVRPAEFAAWATPHASSLSLLRKFGMKEPRSRTNSRHPPRLRRAGTFGRTSAGVSSRSIYVQSASIRSGITDVSALTDEDENLPVSPARPPTVTPWGAPAPKGSASVGSSRNLFGLIPDGTSGGDSAFVITAASGPPGSDIDSDAFSGPTSVAADSVSGSDIGGSDTLARQSSVRSGLLTKAKPDAYPAELPTFGANRQESHTKQQQARKNKKLLKQMDRTQLRDGEQFSDVQLARMSEAERLSHMIHSGTTGVLGPRRASTGDAKTSATVTSSEVSGAVKSESGALGDRSRSTALSPEATTASDTGDAGQGRSSTRVRISEAAPAPPELTASAAATRADARSEEVWGNAAPVQIEGGMDFSRVALLQRRTLALKQKVVAGPKVIAELAESTHFKAAEVKALADLFLSCSDVTGTVGLSGLQALVKPFAPMLAEPHVLPRYMHTIAGADHTGKVTFRGYCTSLSAIVRGSLEEQLNLVFDFYADSAAVNDIGVNELIHLLAKVTPAVAPTLKFAEKVLKVMDFDGNGEIDAKEIQTALMRHPMLMDTFTAFIAVSMSMARAIHDLRFALPTFTFTGLTELVERHRGKVLELTKKVDLVSFRAFLETEFGSEAKHREAVDKLYHQAVMEEEELPVLRDILSGVAQVLAPTTEAQIAFFFSMYDLDGNGTLDQNELMHVLLFAQRRHNPEIGVILGQLSELDTTGTGRLERGDFCMRGPRSSLVRTLLDKLFAGNRDVLGVCEEAQKNPLRVEAPTAVKSALAVPGDESAMTPRTKDMEMLFKLAESPTQRSRQFDSSPAKLQESASDLAKHANKLKLQSVGAELEKMTKRSLDLRLSKARKAIALRPSLLPRSNKGAAADANAGSAEASPVARSGPQSRAGSASGSASDADEEDNAFGAGSAANSPAATRLRQIRRRLTLTRRERTAASVERARNGPDMPPLRLRRRPTAELNKVAEAPEPSGARTARAVLERSTTGETDFRPWSAANDDSLSPAAAASRSGGSQTARIGRFGQGLLRTFTEPVPPGGTALQARIDARIAAAKRSGVVGTASPRRATVRRAATMPNKGVSRTKSKRRVRHRRKRRPKQQGGADALDLGDDVPTVAVDDEEEAAQPANDGGGSGSEGDGKRDAGSATDGDEATSATSWAPPSVDTRELAHDATDASDRDSPRGSLQRVGAASLQSASDSESLAIAGKPRLLVSEGGASEAPHSARAFSGALSDPRLNGPGIDSPAHRDVPASGIRVQTRPPGAPGPTTKPHLVEPRKKSVFPAGFAVVEPEPRRPKPLGPSPTGPGTLASSPVKVPHVPRRVPVPPMYADAASSDGGGSGLAHSPLRPVQRRTTSRQSPRVSRDSFQSPRTARLQRAAASAGSASTRSDSTRAHRLRTVTMDGDALRLPPPTSNVASPLQLAHRATQ